MMTQNSNTTVPSTANRSPQFLGEEQGVHEHPSVPSGCDYPPAAQDGLDGPDQEPTQANGPEGCAIEEEAKPTQGPQEALEDREPMVPQADYQALVSQLHTMEEKLNNTLLQYKEAKEEFEASKRRIQRDIHKELHQLKKTVLLPLLDTVDDLQRALAAPIGDNKEAVALHQGVDMITTRFLKTLEQQDVHAVPLEGKSFDPNLCEAASILPVQQQEQHGLIMAVLRPCYLLGQEVLRSGMVIVGQHHPQGVIHEPQMQESITADVPPPAQSPANSASLADV